ncbi:hypothetical protein [Halobacillus halophilus]|uniref:hypothetical protein n=1 Tax=Halobacillus halophilus TaxID=1570 RepID=UPI001CD7EE19|nr:hypothetical protein [Halobacillus halophilus]MCA1009683.1 hypothetical protein [Halobacillus halophilus]
MHPILKWTLLMIFILYGAYKFRYRVLDMVTKVPLLRRSLVKTSMSVPWVRRKLLAQMFQRPDSKLP